MIISASYKTDIPAFYGDWFLRRLDAGYCHVRNPYNGRNFLVSLQRQDVEGFVFWTKNLGPFLKQLPIVHERGFPFLVQYTINAYPRTLEYSVVNAERSIEHMLQLAEKYGPGVAVWRYDPVVFSSDTPVTYHEDNFARLARDLEGTTDEVVLSFAQIYKKTERNMTLAAAEFGFTWEDPTAEMKLALLQVLAATAAHHGFRLTVCSQPEYIVHGTSPSRCIDADRLMRLWGTQFSANTKGNRPGCFCAESKDIGDYDTCPHGCVYCYAVQNRDGAKECYRSHDPNSESLHGGQTRSSSSQHDLFSSR